MNLSKHKNLCWGFFMALVIRFVLLIPQYGAPLNIVDEQHYNGLAENLLQYHVYGDQEHPSAMRPPLYPFLLALIYKITGQSNQDIVRVLQILLSVFSGLLLYHLFRKLFDEKTACSGFILFLFYPSLLFFNYLVLTETVFIFLLVLFFYFMSRFLTDGTALSSAIAGICLGMASLTRSITYPMAVPLAGLVCILLFRQFRLKAVYAAVVFLLAFSASLSPWTIRNYKVFNAFVPIGTMGGLNLYMGNYEHTPMHRSWAAVDIEGENSWYYGHEQTLKDMNQAEKQKWGIQNAKEYMKSHVGQTILRSIIKTANFWGMERTIIAGMEQGYFTWYSGNWIRFPFYFLILITYAGVVLAGITGLLLKTVTSPARFDFIFGFILIAFTGLHAIVFGHSRYHLPLIPFLCGYTGWLAVNFKNLWQERRKVCSGIGLGVVSIFCCIWGYEILIGSYDKISAMTGH